MARKIFRETKMQSGNIYRPCKGKENIIAIIKQKAERWFYNAITKRQERQC